MVDRVTDCQRMLAETRVDVLMKESRIALTVLTDDTITELRLPEDLLDRYTTAAAGDRLTEALRAGQRIATERRQELLDEVFGMPDVEAEVRSQLLSAVPVARSKGHRDAVDPEDQVSRAGGGAQSPITSAQLRAAIEAMSTYCETVHAAMRAAHGTPRPGAAGLGGIGQDAAGPGAAGDLRFTAEAAGGRVSVAVDGAGSVCQVILREVSDLDREKLGTEVLDAVSAARAAGAARRAAATQDLLARRPDTGVTISQLRGYVRAAVPTAAR